MTRLTRYISKDKAGIRKVQGRQGKNKVEIDKVVEYSETDIIYDEDEGKVGQYGQAIYQRICNIGEIYVWFVC